LFRSFPSPPPHILSLVSFAPPPMNNNTCSRGPSVLQRIPQFKNIKLKQRADFITFGPRLPQPLSCTRQLREISAKMAIERVINWGEVKDGKTILDTEDTLEERKKIHEILMMVIWEVIKNGRWGKMNAKSCTDLD
jgi:hypothetical protein